MHGKPNRIERGVNLRDEPRHTDTSGTGNAVADGYTRRGRRTRVRHGEIVNEDRADMVEEIYSDPYTFGDY